MCRATWAITGMARSEEAPLPSITSADRPPPVIGQLRPDAAMERLDHGGAWLA